MAGTSVRRLVALSMFALSLVLPASALAASVHVRVEGKTQTIYGATEPVLGGVYNALDTLESASIAGEFYTHTTTTSFGRYVDQIGRYSGSNTTGWVFKVNDVSPPVGADAVTLKDGDRVLWYYAEFGPNGGPPTLTLRALKGGCYSAIAYDDNGKPAGVPGLALRVGSKRTVAVKGGKACPGPHPGLLVRGTAPTAVRSNALR